ncbi:MAG: SDR family NAD(P)-dependent oxidoreductase [Mycobacterium leprae]
MIIDLGRDVTRLDGQVAVVTGAGRGIGRETARVLAHLGAVVIIAELHSTGCETEQLIAAEGGHALYIETDVADEESIARLRDRVLATFDKVDILINNATVFTVGPLWEHATAEWDRVMSVNLRGAFLGIKAFLPSMLARKSGVVVTMESADGMPYIGPYMASKVALRSLAQSLAQEVGEESGVSVFCYGPGLVETPGLSGALAHLAPRLGVSRDDFVAQLQAQMISPEATATGLVGAILHAPEFHGEELGFAMGLAKLGLNANGCPIETEIAGPLAGTKPVQTAESGAVYGGAGQALALNRELEGILATMAREYNEQNAIVRPIVRRMFQQGTGLKMEEWIANAQAVSQRLAAGAGMPDGGDAGRTTYVRHLERLAAFLVKQEGDARGFFKNQQALNVALAALRDRRAVVTQLVDLLGNK